VDYMSADHQVRTRALVVGGGIAGLSTALALGGIGWDVEVIERSPKWSPGGTGIFLPANAHRAMRALGVAEAVAERSRVIERQLFFDHKGRILADVDLSQVWGEVGPCLALTRPGLHAALLEASDSTRIQLGTMVASMDQGDGVVEVELTDGTAGVFDLVVGADGIDSSVRRLAFDGSHPGPVGQVSWRFLTQAFPGIDTWTAMLGRGRSFLMVPVGEGRTYCYMDMVGTGPGDPTGGDKRLLADLFADFGPPARDIFEAMPQVDNVYFGPIEEVVDETRVSGRVVLVGDAAHATSPNMAQGAAMAFEDAVVLSQSLAASPTIDEAIGSYLARRRPRTRWVRDQTHRRDRLRGSPEVIRNLSLRLAGLKIVRSNYRPLLEGY
jgi:2-polyprenyl-6-methoxyphenol hydroxylase-like FAD-dependent oxidoreductase